MATTEGEAEDKGDDGGDECDYTHDYGEVAVSDFIFDVSGFSCEEIMTLKVLKLQVPTRGALKNH